MIIKTRSIFDCEVSTLVDFDKIDASSSLRASDIEEPKTGEEDKFSEEPKHDQHFWRVYSRRRKRRGANWTVRGQNQFYKRGFSVLEGCERIVEKGGYSLGYAAGSEISFMLFFPFDN